VLTDITGFEDAFGLMDFKVAGTQHGITAIQMDIKYKGGLPRSVFEKALAQAKDARLLILSKMKHVMSKPKTELSALVPQVTILKVPTDKIGAIIGSGGKVKLSIKLALQLILKMTVQSKYLVNRVQVWNLQLCGLKPLQALFNQAPSLMVLYDVLQNSVFL
jgi:polyribonucleotide nucleotidyltransferase